MGQTWSRQEDEYLIQLFDSATGEYAPNTLKLDKILSEEAWSLIAEAMECQFQNSNIGRVPERRYNAANVSRHWKHDLKPLTYQIAPKHRTQFGAHLALEENKENIFDITQLPMSTLKGKRPTDSIIKRKPPPPPPGFSSHGPSAAESSKAMTDFYLNVNMGNMPPPPRITAYSSESAEPSRASMANFDPEPMKGVASVTPRPNPQPQDVLTCRDGGTNVSDILQNLISAATDIGMGLLFNVNWIQKPTKAIDEREDLADDEEGDNDDCSDDEEAEEMERLNPDTELDGPVRRIWMKRHGDIMLERAAKRKSLTRKGYKIIETEF